MRLGGWGWVLARNCCCIFERFTPGLTIQQHDRGREVQMPRPGSRTRPLGVGLSRSISEV